MPYLDVVGAVYCWLRLLKRGRIAWLFVQGRSFHPNKQHGGTQRAGTWAGGVPVARVCVLQPQILLGFHSLQQSGGGSGESVALPNSELCARLRWRARCIRCFHCRWDLKQGGLPFWRATPGGQCSSASPVWNLTVGPLLAPQIVERVSLYV